MRGVKFLYGVAVGLALMVAACGVEGPPADDPAAAAGSAATSTSDEISTPAELDLITPAVTCSSQHGSCLRVGLCGANCGHVITATGCPAQQQCCVFSGRLCVGGDPAQSQSQ